MRCSHHENAFKSINSFTGRVLQNDVSVTRFLYAAGNLIQRPVPILLFPFIAVRSPIHGLQQTMLAGIHGKKRRALRAESR